MKKLKRQNDREIRRRKNRGGESISPDGTSDEAADDKKEAEEKERLLEEAQKKERAQAAARSGQKSKARAGDKQAQPSDKRSGNANQSNAKDNTKKSASAGKKGAKGTPAAQDPAEDGSHRQLTQVEEEMEDSLSVQNDNNLKPPASGRQRQSQQRKQSRVGSVDSTA